MTATLTISSKQKSQELLSSLPTEHPSTIVKYDVPELAAKKLRNGKFVESPAVAVKNRIPISFTSVTAAQGYVCVNGKKYDKDQTTTEDDMKRMLSRLFPSYTWRQGKNVYTQHVSMEKGTNIDFANLAQLLCDKLYPERHYPKFTISEDYVTFATQAFDELNRQILLDKPLAGILLRQIRDYLLEEIENRRKLCISYSACAGRKELHLFARIKELQQKHLEYKNLKARLKSEIETLEKQLNSIKSERNSLSVEAEEMFHHDVQNLITEKRRQNTKLRQMAGLAT